MINNSLDQATVRAILAAEFMLSDGAYPLQRKCPNTWCEKGKGCMCRGSGYVFNSDPNLLWAAVKEAGGSLRVWINQQDGKFYAECRLGSPLNKPQVVAADTATEALELAVYLAMKVE